MFFEFTGGSKQPPVASDARITRLVEMWGAVQAAFGGVTGAGVAAHRKADGQLT